MIPDRKPSRAGKIARRTFLVAAGVVGGGLLVGVGANRDRIYGSVVMRRSRAMGIRDRPITPSSPWQNAFAERLIGSIRRECVDHIIVLGEAHLRRILESYSAYYNNISASVIG